MNFCKIFLGGRMRCAVLIQPNIIMQTPVENIDEVQTDHLFGSEPWTRAAGDLLKNSK